MLKQATVSTKKSPACAKAACRFIRQERWGKRARKMKELAGKDESGRKMNFLKNPNVKRQYDIDNKKKKNSKIWVYSVKIICSNKTRGNKYMERLDVKKTGKDKEIIDVNTNKHEKKRCIMNALKMGQIVSLSLIHI